MPKKQEWPRAVRTTFRPDVEVEVGQAEYLDLERQNLLVRDEPAPESETPDPEHEDAPAVPLAGNVEVRNAVRKPRNERN